VNQLLRYITVNLPDGCAEG